MTDDPTRLPTRLRATGATDFERRLLEAGANERPSPELTRRMQRGLGLSAAAAVTAASVSTHAAAVTKTVFWARVSSGLLAAVVAGGVIGSQVYTRAPSHGAPPVRVATVVAAAPVAATRAAPAEALVPSVERPSPAAPEPRPRRARHRTIAAGGDLDQDLRAEIALVDAARAALRAGAPARALALLERHAATYRAGTFRPEVTALRIEALDATGRTAEARGLARRFVAEHPDSPLTDRVARFAGPPAR